MTYLELQEATTVLLIADTVLPADPGLLQALVRMNLHRLAMDAEAINLMTRRRTPAVLRKAAPKGWYIRIPDTPIDPTDLLDLDEQLCYVLANYIASSLSRNNAAKLLSDAKMGVIDYNSKVYDIISDIEKSEDDTLEISL